MGVVFCDSWCMLVYVRHEPAATAAVWPSLLNLYPHNHYCFFRCGAQVIDALRVRRSGFPNTLRYRDFCLRFRLFLPPHDRGIISRTDAGFHGAHGGSGGGGGASGSSSFAGRASEVLGSFASGFGGTAAGNTGRGGGALVKLSDDEWRRYIAAVFAHPLACACVTRAEYEVGVTKVFLRANVLHRLETAQTHMQHAAATKLQAIVKRFLMLLRYRAMKAAAIKCHAIARGIITRYRFDKLLMQRRREVKRKLVCLGMQG